MIEREAVVSSNLAEVGYDPASEILEVMFRNGGIYQYYGVSSLAHEQMMEAESIGRHFNSNIKGKYREKRM